jgi:selenocysteine-specific translation elongation factor
LDGYTLGVFGTDVAAKTAFEAAVAKKSEVEGIVVYSRTESGKRISFLDEAEFPERVQGYSRLASLVDYAYYVFPKSGRLTAADGELVVLLDGMGVKGSVLVLDESVPTDMVQSVLKGSSLANFHVERRTSGSPVIDLSTLSPREDSPSKGCLIYVDRVFPVKGVGIVVLGFVLSGAVSLHDEFRMTPGPAAKKVEVKGIQVNDVDQESVGRGIRVGLSLRGVELKDIEKTCWLDDGSFTLSDRLDVQFVQSKYYKQPVEGREMHLQLPGELLPSKFTSQDSSSLISAQLPYAVPCWKGMRTVVLDLNAKGLRVAGGCTVSL